MWLRGLADAEVWSRFSMALLGADGWSAWGCWGGASDGLAVLKKRSLISLNFWSGGKVRSAFVVEVAHQARSQEERY